MAELKLKSKWSISNLVFTVSRSKQTEKWNKTPFFCKCTFFKKVQTNRLCSNLFSRMKSILEGSSPTTVVIDSGNWKIKAGFAGDKAPTICEHTDPNIKLPTSEKRRQNPIYRGYVCDWEEMESRWTCLLEKLDVCYTKQPVLMTEPTGNSKTSRLQLAEYFFEGLGTTALMVQSTGILSLFSAGIIAGVSLESGDGLTDVTPVVDGFRCVDHVQRIPLAGRDLTLRLEHLLEQRGYSTQTLNSKKVKTQVINKAHLKQSQSRLNWIQLNDIKKQFCFVAVHYKNALQDMTLYQRNFEKLCTLPDGTKIVIGTEQIKTPEPMFETPLYLLPPERKRYQNQYIETTKQYEGENYHVPLSVQEAVGKCAAIVSGKRHAICPTIPVVLGGGNTMITGFPERLRSELENNSFKSSKDPKIIQYRKDNTGYMAPLRIVAGKERSLSAWKGGSILSSLPTFNDLWLSKAEWEEKGTSIYYQKCFT